MKATNASRVLALFSKQDDVWSFNIWCCLKISHGPTLVTELLKNQDICILSPRLDCWDLKSEFMQIYLTDLQSAALKEKELRSEVVFCYRPEGLLVSSLLRLPNVKETLLVLRCWRETSWQRLSGLDMTTPAHNNTTVRFTQEASRSISDCV